LGLVSPDPDREKPGPFFVKISLKIELLKSRHDLAGFFRGFGGGYLHSEKALGLRFVRPELFLV
jgi:hypothetical protein